MDLTRIWPLFGLELETPRLVLSPVRDDDLPDLADAALRGVHAPDRMPFSSPWTDAGPAELPRNLAQYQWGLRGRVSPEDWIIEFAVRLDGEIVGAQGLTARGFADCRTVTSGSWLTAAAQGRGVGTEMRAAVLLFAFDVLGAEWAESAAASWNAASLAVSRRLGYVENGVTRVSPRPGEPIEELRMRLARTDFRRPAWALAVRGADPVLAQLGVRRVEGGRT